MKFAIRSLTVASILAMGGVAAHAADLTYEPAPVAAAPEVFNWTGFYVGVHGGVAAGDFKYPLSINSGDFSTSGELKQDADIAAASYEGKISGNVAGFGFDAGSEVEWFGTVRGRVGYALDNLLLYGTGGFAYGDVKSSININGSGVSTSDTQYGWTAGAGFEYGITKNITLKTEYLYVDLGSQTLLDLPINDTANLKMDADTHFHTLKAGLNYKF
jgi:outer membrane immunogenic protein